MIHNINIDFKLNADNICDAETEVDRILKYAKNCILTGMKDRYVIKSQDKNNTIGRIDIKAE